jgi:hypothetical protein
MKKLDPVVANDPVLAFIDAIDVPSVVRRVENDADDATKADAVASVAVTRVDNDPDAVTKADEVASAAVTLVESEPDVETYSDDVNSVFVIRVDSEDENANVSVGRPAIDPENEPVMPCVADIVPVTVSEPDTVGLY